VRTKNSLATAIARLSILLAMAVWPAIATAAPVRTAALNYEPAVKEAYQHLYNLDYDGALSRFEQVSKVHPNDPLATSYVLNCVVFQELYRLDLLDTTFYANDGFLTGKHIVSEDPKVTSQVNLLADKAIQQADDELKAHPDDLDALFARGWARSLKATYMALVQRSFTGALHLALQARSDHQQVLNKDPNYVDAKMVVGIHEFVVGSLQFGFRLVVGVAGISGSKSKGLELLHDSAARGVMTSVESRTALAFFLRREGRYKEAITIVQSQARQYPRDFLFALEEANLLKDDGQGPAAVAAYRQLLTEAKIPGRYPSAHLELAWFGLGDTLRGQNMNDAAVNAFEQAASQPTTSPELKARSLLEVGQVYDVMKKRDKARDAYEAAVAAGPQTTQADEARKYLRTAYTP
jgi:tetratricopeptide (TPR) repeat protein